MASQTVNILDQYIRSKSTPIEVREAIIDRTTTQDMDSRTVDALKAAVRAAASAGLVRIEITAARGTGHRSHDEGTELDVKGYNADGSLWTNSQRIAVAEGARLAGADRFGIYMMNKGVGKGTLHFGFSGPKRPPAVWGANGLTSSAEAVMRRLSPDAPRRFADPDEIAFLQRYQAHSSSPSVPMPRLNPRRRSDWFLPEIKKDEQRLPDQPRRDDLPFRQPLGPASRFDESRPAGPHFTRGYAQSEAGEVPSISRFGHGPLGFPTERFVPSQPSGTRLDKRGDSNPASLEKRLAEISKIRSEDYHRYWDDKAMQAEELALLEELMKRRVVV